MEIKTESENSDNERLKFHLRKKLKKAVSWAKELDRLIQARGDSESRLEAEGYLAVMTGHLSLELEQWQTALTAYVTVRRIYEQMGQLRDTEHQTLCRQFLEDLEPSIRYCNYSLGGEQDYHALLAMQSSAKNSLLEARLDSVITQVSTYSLPGPPESDRDRQGGELARRCACHSE